MTIGELLDRVERGDPEAAVRLSDAFRARGWTHANLCDFVAERRGVERPTFEALLLEGDSTAG